MRQIPPHVGPARGGNEQDGLSDNVERAHGHPYRGPFLDSLGRYMTRKEFETLENGPKGRMTN